MILGIFLSPGDSMTKQALVGQDQRFIDFYLKNYSKKFEKVFIFSYGDLRYKGKLPLNVILLPNKFHIYYSFYQFMLVFLYRSQIQECQIFRVMQATGAIPGILARLFFEKKYIVTYGYNYSNFAKIEGKLIRSYLLKYIVKIFLIFADKIIVTSRENFKKLKRNYSGKLYYLPNGVDVEVFKPRRKPKIRIWNLLNIGRLVKQKNQELLIRAINASSFKNNIKLTLIGNGNNRIKLVDLANKYRISLRIIDKVKHDHLYLFYNKADAFCLPSLAEGSPKVLLEAMSCGLPVLASKNEANLEIIENSVNGLLFSLSVNDLKNKLDYLIKNVKLQNTLRINARKDIVKKFNIKNILAKEINLIRKSYV